MPIYEYMCANCNHKIDVIQKVNDPKLTNCSECGNDSLEKMVSAPSFKLKGTGWYETDFKHSNKDTKQNVSSNKEPGSKPEKTKTVK